MHRKLKVREIKIIVMAEEGNGKTTIANQIANFMNCAGLDVDIVDDEPKQSIEKMAVCFAGMVCNKDYHITVATKQIVNGES